MSVGVPLLPAHDAPLNATEPAENSHQPTRRRERQMQRFKSAGQAQRFLSAHGPIRDHFQPRRHRLSAPEYRAARTRAFAIWRLETCGRVAA